MATSIRQVVVRHVHGSPQEERAQVPDQYERAEALQHLGVEASVYVAPQGHRYVYWGKVREQAIAFLSEHAE
jgi:hypothetical protein